MEGVLGEFHRRSKPTPVSIRPGAEEAASNNLPKGGAEAASERGRLEPFREHLRATEDIRGFGARFGSLS